MVMWEENHDDVDLYIGLIYNNPPDAPDIDGTTTGEKGTQYENTVAATDPEDDNVYLFVDWGDDTNTSWLGPFEPDNIPDVNHTWMEGGDFVIRCKVKDVFGNESDWSENLTMQIASPEIESITGGLGVTVTVNNTGTATSKNLTVKLHVEGGILNLINKTVNETYDIEAGGSQTLSTGILIGLGSIDITVKAGEEEKTATGIQIIIFTLVS